MLITFKLGYTNKATMRIQKYLSQQKILSRREAEHYIKLGLIKLNGQIVREMGIQIDPAKDKVEVLAAKPGKISDKITVAVNKPRGIVSSKIKTEGETIFELLPQFEHLNVVGRLDKESEGLILLSNDGTITQVVTSDKHLIEKEYEVTVRELIKPSMLLKMENGLILEDGPTLETTTELLDDHKFMIILKEGRKHQIRRMCDVLRLTVTDLKRIRIGNIKIGHLKTGQFRELNKSEIEKLKG